MKSVYLDTMIFSFLVYRGSEKKAKQFADLTRNWFKIYQQEFSLYISRAVITELENGHFRGKSRAIEIADRLSVFPDSPEILEIAKTYVDSGIMPKTGLDAVHLAYASMYEADYLLSWNYKHIVNESKYGRIQKINQKIGLKTPEIVDPMKLLEVQT